MHSKSVCVQKKQEKKCYALKKCEFFAIKFVKIRCPKIEGVFLTLVLILRFLAVRNLEENQSSHEIKRKIRKKKNSGRV